MARWTRPHFVPGGGDARVDVVVYTLAEVTGLTVSRSRHGVPDDAKRFNIRLDDHARHDAPAHFAELRSPELREVALRDGLALDRLLEASHQVRVTLTEPDPPDAEHLRLVWGFVHAICDAQEVLGVFDREARRFWSAEHIRSWPPRRTFEPADERSILFTPREVPGFGHVCYTRGLCKLGRPDLVLVDLFAHHAEWAGQLIEPLATRLALGARLQPGQIATIDGRRLKADLARVGDNAPDLCNAGPHLLLSPL